jgi:hypothetical protein
MSGSAFKDRVVYPLQKRVVNPVVMLARSRIGWRAGSAQVLDDDDPRKRQRLISLGNLARRFCVGASRAMATSPLAVRIDLDP